ncbi:MAG TPA: hypothetical protein VKY90_09930 [Candidatus Dormibacteraeota bacterium]|nr:hypothetical protein [Candidatus Dormibacteraeota bacterium]
MSPRPGGDDRPGWGRLLRRRSEAPWGTSEQVIARASAGPPLTPTERARLPAMSRCLSCGLCALIAGRAGRARLPDLASAYLRDPSLLERAAADVAGEGPGAAALAAASAVCPVGVPLDQVAALARRLARPEP